MKKNAATRTGTPMGVFSPPPIGLQGQVVHHPVHPVAGQMVHQGDASSQSLSSVTPMNGQHISVNVTSADPNLSLGEWIRRGVLSALGNGLLFPFRLLGKLIEGVMMGVLGIVRVAILIVLVPTLIWAGIMLQQHLSKADSVREGAASATVQGGEVLKGLSDGARAKRDPLQRESGRD